MDSLVPWLVSAQDLDPLESGGGAEQERPLEMMRMPLVRDGKLQNRVFSCLHVRRICHAWVSNAGSLA